MLLSCAALLLSIEYWYLVKNTAGRHGHALALLMTNAYGRSVCERPPQTLGPCPCTHPHPSRIQYNLDHQHTGTIFCGPGPAFNVIVNDYDFQTCLNCIMHYPPQSRPVALWIWLLWASPKLIRKSELLDLPNLGLLFVPLFSALTTARIIPRVWAREGVLLGLAMS